MTETQGRAFFAAVAAATLLPFLGFPLLSLLGVSGPQDIPNRWLALALIAVLAGGGAGHVGTSIWFYFDKDYRPILDADKNRFYMAVFAIPLATVIVAMLLVWQFTQGGFFIVALFYTVWLFYHYQRQNYGLTSFAAANQNAGPLPPALNTALVLASVAGAIAVLGLHGFYPPFIAWDTMIGDTARTYLRSVALGVYAVSAVLFVKTVIETAALRKNPLVLGCATLSEVFFIPALLFQNPFAAVISFATAHGAQYVLMMGITSKRSSWGWPALFVVGGGMVGWWKASAIMANAPIWAMVAMGLTMVHFVIDAKLWRLREPAQRKIVRGRFSFIFPSKPSAA